MIRRWLARMLAPDMARDADRWNYASGLAHDAWRWLGDDEGGYVIAWLLQSTARRFDPTNLTESEFAPHLGNIRSFREWLRERLRARRKGLPP